MVDMHQSMRVVYVGVAEVIFTDMSNYGIGPDRIYCIVASGLGMGLIGPERWNKTWIGLMRE